MNRRSKFTRLISSLLTLVMLFSTIPTTAYASVIGDGGGDEGFSGGGNWRANWNENQLGIRVSIVNHDGKNVLINSESGKPYVVDILFSQPSNVDLYMKGSKFQDWNGDVGQDILPIPVWKLNGMLNEAIKANPAINLNELPHYDTWGNPYKGLPVPIIKSSKTGDWIGNGLEVKKFFIEGKQGSINTGWTPSIDVSALPQPNKKPSGGSSANQAGSNAGKPATNNRGEANTIKTPYGNVTAKWLEEHRRAVQNNSLTSYINSGHITSSERQQINSHIEATRKTNIGALTSAIRRLINNVEKPTTATATRPVTLSEFNSDSYNWGKQYYWYIASDYDTGKVTFEAMRVNNSKLSGLSEISRNRYAAAYSIYENKTISNKTKIFMLNTIMKTADSFYYSSIEVTNGTLIDNESIPLIPGKSDIGGSIVENLTEQVYSQLIDVVLSILETGITDSSKLTDEQRVELLKGMTFNQNFLMKKQIMSVMYQKYGENANIIIEKLGGLDSLTGKLITSEPSEFVNMLEQAGKDLELSEEKANALTTEQWDSMFDINIGDIEAASKTDEAQGINSDEIVVFTASMVDEIIKSIVRQLEAQGINSIKYENVLAKLAGDTKEEKLEKAAIQINNIGLQQWVDSLGLAVEKGFEDSNIDLYKNPGYIAALLDIKPNKDATNYIFDIQLEPEVQAQYEKMLALTGDGNQDGRPSYKYLLGDYALVIEPVYWYKPVSRSSGQWNSDRGANDSAGRFLYRSKSNVYGTPTNFAKWMNAKNTNYPDEIGHGSLNRLMAMSMYINEDIVYFNSANGNETIHPINVPSGDLTNNGTRTAAWRAKLSDTNLSGNNFGYGWHFAGGNTATTSPLSGTITWKSPDPSPGKAPDPSGLPDPSKDTEGKEVIDDNHPNGIPDKHFTIIKYYEDRDYTEDPDFPEITRSGPTIREQNPNKIRIVDEPKYKVEDWYTTVNVPKPTENDTTDDYYIRKDDTSSENIVKRSTPSNKTTTVELDKENKYKTDPENAEQILFVLLVKETKAPIEEGKITIQQSQITKAVHTNNKTIGGNWGNYNFTFTIGSFQESHAGDCGSCHGGHGEDGSCGSCHGGHVCKFSMPGGAGDDKLKFVFTGLHSINFGKQPEVGDSKHKDLKPLSYASNGIHDKTLSSLSQATFKFVSNGMAATGAEYTTVLWRFNDIPTLAQYKKTDITNKYGKLNYEIPATILPQSNIAQNKRTRDKVYTSSIALDFGINKGLSDLKATASCNGGYVNCFATDTQDVQASTWSYLFGADVIIKTYRGKDKVLAQEPFEGKTEKHVTNSTGVHFANTTIQDKQQIKFFPYIKMTYQTNELNMILAEEQSNANTRYETYVLSEQKSSILPSDAVEVGWTNPNETNSLNLVSQQWSLHQKAITGSDGWQGKNQVLPGGAIYQLNTGKSETNVKLVTYQTVVDQKTRDYLSDALTGSEYTEDEVKKEHKDFVDVAKDVLDNLRVVQWVNKNVKDETAWPTGWAEASSTSQVCVRGGNQSLSLLGLNNTTNSDTKYYMQKAGFGQAASEGDLDIMNETQITTVFKVFADTEGTVWMVKAQDSGNDVNGLVDQLKDINADTVNSKMPAEKLADKTTKWENVNESLTGEAKAIDDRTKIITNVVKSLERNTGVDKSAAWSKRDGKWYNEAFDGIYLVRQSTTLQVGFKDPAKRAAALDPALSPENKGQSDLYSKAFLSQFCMNDKSDSKKAEGKDSQYIGTFKGVDIKLPDMQGLYQSRQFFIPNANVQDLK